MQKTVYDFAAKASSIVNLTPAEIAAITPTVEQAKAAKLAALQSARDAAESANVIVQGKVFSADTKITDRFEKLASRLRRGKPTKLSAIYTVDGSPVTPTAQLMEQIEDAVADQMEEAWNRYGQRVAAVMAATTVDQVNAVGW